MDEYTTGVVIKPSYTGVIYSATRRPDVFKIEVGDLFVQGVTDPLKTIDSTVGGMHRKHLHELLDEWIDNALKEKNT